jgi:hypothetical protein
MISSDQLLLPAPRNWQDFQRLVRALFTRVWQDPHAQEYGRPGQNQGGVDIVGVRHSTGDREAVQCKAVQQLTEAIIRNDYERSKELSPSIQVFIIATTANRDTHLQNLAAELSSIGSPRCIVSAWEDLCVELAPHADLLQQFYPMFFNGNMAGVCAKYISLNDDTTHHELLISGFPPDAEQYKNCLLIVDLHSRMSTTFSLGGHWSRFSGIVGITKRDAFVVSKWLESFASPDDLFGRKDIQFQFRLGEHQEREWKDIVDNNQNE